MADKIIRLSDGTDSLLPVVTKTVTLSSGGSASVTLLSGATYLVSVHRQNGSVGQLGLYLIGAYAGANSFISAIKASTAVTMNMSNNTLTISSSQNYVRIGIFMI